MHRKYMEDHISNQQLPTDEKYKDFYNTAVIFIPPLPPKHPVKTTQKLTTKK